MKALFVYTAKVFKAGSSHYSNNLPSSIWRDRYRKLFDEVTVYARQIDVATCSEACSDYEGVNFCLTHLGVNKKELILKRSEIYKEIEKLVLESDFIIARMGFFGVLAAKCARLNDKPYVCECAGSSWDDLWNYSLSGKLAALWLQPQVKYEFAKAKFAVYVTNEYLQNEYPCKGKTIGISNVILSKHEESVIHNRLKKIDNHTNDNPYVIGTAAAVDVPYKGQRFVINALKKLKEHGYYCLYKIAGNGNPDKLIEIAKENGVEEYIDFVGTLPHHEMPDYFDGLDIYIQPSLQEGLPRAMIEAMGRGLPAIGFKTAGIPELIEPIFVCRQKNISDIVEKIEKLIQNKELMKKTAERNFRKSFEYEKEILESKWLSFYTDAIESQVQTLETYKNVTGMDL